MQATSRQYRIANTVYFFISGFGYTSWASRIPAIQQQLHLSDGKLGAVLFALPIGLMLTFPLMGKLLRRYTSKQVMLAGAILYNIFLAIPGFTREIWEIIPVLLVFGASRNLLNLSMNAQALGVQGLYKKSIMTTFHGVWSLAGFGGAILSYLMVHFNISPTYHLLTVSVLLLTLTFSFYPSSIELERSTDAKRYFLMPDKTLVKFALIAFASMACENTMYDWSSIYFQQEVHQTKSFSTAAFVLYMFAITIGRFSGDHIVSMFGIPKILKFSGFFVTAGYMLCIIAPYTVPALAGFTLIGLGVSCIVPLVFSLASTSKNVSAGAALVSISTIGYSGFLMVPPVVGFISQALNLRFAFLVMAALSCMIIVLISAIMKNEKLNGH